MLQGFHYSPSCSARVPMALDKRIHCVCVCVCVYMCVCARARALYNLADANLHACMIPTVSSIKLFGYQTTSV